MAAHGLVGTNGRIEFTLEGLTFVRSKSQAADRGTSRLLRVDWEEISSAELVDSGRGKPVVWITLADAVTAPDPKKSPHAVKVKRARIGEAGEFVDRVNEEIRIRRRWSTAGDDPPPDR